MSAQLLLVDDEPGLREAVKDFLQESGFRVQVASNAREGWDWMQQNMPDLVISDIARNDKDDLDGLQFLSELRKTDDDTPVIFYVGVVQAGKPVFGEWAHG